MKYALTLPNGGPWSDPRTLADLAQRAEDAGWDGIFLEDYIVWQNDENVPTHDPWIVLAAMAMRTNRIRLATSVTPLARRRPWKVAREAVSLDHLSDGRFILAVGLGDTGESVGSDTSLTHFGEVLDTRQRARMLDEALEIIAGLWTGDPFELDGEFYKLRKVRFQPRPVQTPRIPIWIGGGWPLRGPTRRAARWDGSRLYKHHGDGMTPDDIRALRAIVQEERGSVDGYDIVISGIRRLDGDAQRERLEAFAEAGATWCAEYMSPKVHDLAAVRAIIAEGPLHNH